MSKMKSQSLIKTFLEIRFFFLLFIKEILNFNMQFYDINKNTLKIVNCTEFYELFIIYFSERKH